MSNQQSARSGSFERQRIALFGRHPCEKDLAFRRHIGQITCRGLWFAGLAAFLLTSIFVLYHVLIGGRDIGWAYQSGAYSTTVVMWDKVALMMVGAIAMIFSRICVNENWGRLVAAILFVTGCVLILFDDFMYQNVTGSTSYIVLVLLIAAGSIPFKPFQVFFLSILSASLLPLFLLILRRNVTEEAIASLESQTVFIIMAAVVLTGITALINRYRIEQFLLRQDLESLNQSLGSTLEELHSAQAQIVQSEKMVLIGQLSAGVAHEINNPINFVSSNVEPLLRDFGDLKELIRRYDAVVEEEKFAPQFEKVNSFKSEIDLDIIYQEIDQLLKGIREGAGRTAGIVRSLRSFIWTDEAPKQPADVHEGLETTLLLLGNELQRRNITVVKRYGDLPPISCYPSKLNQVFLSILTNAATAIGENGEILITSGYSEGNTVLSFGDTGPGFDKEQISRIFEPHYTKKANREETGQGLWISQEIIREHGGTISVQNREEGGALVSVSIPMDTE